MGKDLKTDFFIWKSFIDGNDDSFYRLYEQYFDVLFQFGIQFSKDKEFIKDCIHDLFLDLYKYRANLSETDSIKFYLLRSFRRKIHSEKLKMQPFLYDYNLADYTQKQVSSFEETLISAENRKENLQLLNDAMKRLTDRQREGLSLKFVQNLTYPEIAEMLDMSVESARTSIYRSLKILRKAISDEHASIQLLFFLYGGRS
jgi:RNA polymerase sigma factor (sigma-70 family)